MTSEREDILWRESHQAGPEARAVDQSLRVDLLVVGAGFTGCSAALEGAQLGASVAVLEANTIGHGGSGRNVGLVNAGLWLPPDDIVKHLGETVGAHLVNVLSRAPDAVFQLIKDHAIDCEATRNGTLHLAHAPSGLDELKRRFQQGNRSGAPVVLLDAEETERRTGSTAFFGSLFDPRAGTIQPLAYVRGLARAAQSAGAQIFEHSAVQKIRRVDDIWVADVNGHQVRARYLLVATNAYASRLGPYSKPEFVPVYYSQFATAPLSEAQRETILPGGEGCWDTDMVMSSVRVDTEGRVIVGGVGNVTGGLGAVHRTWAARKLAQIYPELSGAAFEHSWSGAIAMTANHLPKVQSIGPDGLSVFGFSGRGIGPGTVFGKCAVQAMLSGDMTRVPVPITDTYREGFKVARTAYFELGAGVAHALNRFRGGRPRRV
ncbi:NAD(P)/FAD-dependent oxidoreductase [Shimia abyssi]|uniref:Glycine/D-amino acid oxidase-like deaminating enzyme n=1 Tax=Shimia abyssi TaxID=1662395 RepID=A0A2P8FGU7_9RHOB|nr:FAD-dependent oxidoreductase [Shimia abyssi]PSL20918.1 glycine/D-amino acid oxidase-like deaminating enzyme [Shimia abyssi]